MTDIEATVGTDSALLRQLLAGAAGPARPWGDASPSQRAGAIRAVADALDAAVDELVPLADEESHLGTGRLTGELGRTTFQLRLSAEVLAAALPTVAASPLLNDRIAARRAELREQLATREGVQVLVPGGGPDAIPAPALRDGNPPRLPRRVDGRWQPAPADRPHLRPLPRL